MRFEFPTAAPANVGIPSAAIDRFLTRLEDRRMPMHSVLMLKDGQMIFENYWKPFNKDRKHRLYSSSKSFTSVAIGILVGDGVLSLDDPVTKFFPEKSPQDLHPWLAATTIRDLLMMTTPLLRGGTCTYKPTDPDWAETYFRTEPTHMPGKIYSYDTTATTMLSIIIARAAGKEFCDLLRERLFIPAGMNEDITCIQTPCGHDWGGSGILATPRDFMKFAYCCMNGGRINGQQLIPEDYIRAATSKQIDTNLRADMADSTFGYGYHFWRTRHNGFACRGMGSQMAVCLPDQGFILITTGDTQGISAAPDIIYDALWTEIWPYLENNTAVTEDAGAYESLCNKWADREIEIVKGEKSSPKMREIDGKTFVFEQPNEPGLKWARFTFEGDEGLLEYENADGKQSLRFGLGHQTEGKLSQTKYYGKRIGTPKGEGYACTASAAWPTEDLLYIICYAIDDYMGTLAMNFAFNDGCITYYGRNYAEWFFNEFWGFASGREEKA